MSDFQVFAPLPVTDAILTSNVYETPPAAYAGGSTYAAGDHVSVMTGTLATIYKSLQAGNIGHTPSSSPLWWQEVGTAYALWDSGTAYAIDDIVTDVASHKLYKSTQAGTNHPITDENYWFEYSLTNKWKMFGQITTNQTEWYEEIEVVLSIDQIFNKIVLFELSAATLQIIVNDGVDDVYDETISLINNDGIYDYFEYFFNPIIYRRGYTITEGLPNLASATLTIRLAGDNTTVKSGKIAVGYGLTFGQTLFGASFKNRDFSVVEENELGGDPYIVERTYRRSATFNVRLPASDKDYFYETFSGFRATPVVIIANPNYAVGVVYGIPTFTLVADNPNLDLVTLDIKGF